MFFNNSEGFMRNKFVLCIIVVGLVFSGCSKQVDDNSSAGAASEVSSMGQKMQSVKLVAAKTSKEAIALADKLKTVGEKKDYLIAQAQAFYKSEEFEQVVEVTQYVLGSLDKDSNVAKNLIEKAKNELRVQATSKVEDVKNALGDFGK